MPAIASVFVEVLPETSRIAEGIRKAVREADTGLPKLHVDADTTQAEEKIDKAARERKPKIKPEADTGKAEEELDKTARDRKTKIKVDVDKSQLDYLDRLMQGGFDKQAQAFSNLLKARRDFGSEPFSDPLDYSRSILNIRSATQAFESSMSDSVSSGIQSGGSAGISALQPALLGIGATMLAGIASALSGLAGLIPAGLLGAGGVVGTLAVGLDGVKDAYDAVNKAAQSSGQDQIDKARETATAQRGLTDAVQSQAQAQRDVSAAYRDARNNLDDLNLSLQGGKISEAQAYNNVLKARRDLAQGGFKDTLDLRDAQLRVASAEQQWQESRQRNVELSQKANDANSKGIENSDQVVSAKERERKANEQVAAAQDSLSLAQNKTSAAAKDAALEMAKLSPNAQAFVDTLMAMKPQFQEFKNSIQDALFANLGPQFQQLATTYLPLLQQFMGGMASTMNQAFGQIATFLQNPQTMAAMQQIFANIGQSFQIWSQSLQPFSEAFLKITQVGSGFLPELAQMVGQVANAFNQWAQSGQLGQWIQTGMDALRQLGGLIQQLLPMFMQLAPIGTATLGALNQVLAALAPSIGPLAQAFANWVVAMTPLLTMVAQLITALMPAFIGLMDNLNGSLTQTAGPLTTVVGWIGSLTDALSNLGDPKLMGEGPAAFFNSLRDSISSVLNPLEMLVNLVTSVHDLFTGEGTAVDNAQKNLDAALDRARHGQDPFGGGGGSFDLPAPGAQPAIPPPWTPPGGKPMQWVPGQGYVPMSAATSTTVGGQDWLAQQLMAAGLSPDETKGILAMNTVEGGAADPKSLLGFTESQAQGPQAHVQAFLKQWNDPSRRQPGGGIPGVGPSGQVADWDAYMKWIRERIVGQTGVSSDWQGNAQPPASVYQQRLMQALGQPPATGGVPPAMPPVMPTAPTTAAPPAIPTGAALPDAHGAHPQIAMVEQIAQKFGLTLTAGKDDHAADGGFHPRGMAGDFSNGQGNTPQELAFAQYMAQNFAPYIQELIYSDPNFNGLIGGGKNVSGTNYYSASTLADHTDHVHIAIKDEVAQAFAQASGSQYGPGQMPSYPGTGGPSGSQQDPMYVAMTPDMMKQQQQAGPGQQLGQDFLSGIGQVFGLDGSVFKDPTSFGLFKLFKGFMGLKPKDGGSSDGSISGGGGGGGLFSSLLQGIIPQPFGPLQSGSPKDAPGQFMPGMPGSQGGGAVNFPQIAQGAPGAPGPGNVDNSITVNTTGTTQQAFDSAHGANVPRMRQQLRPLP